MYPRRHKIAGIIAALVLLALGAGCQRLPFARLAGGSAAMAPQDNGTPARVESSGTVTTVALPTGSVVSTTSPTDTAPAATVVTLAAPSELRTETRSETAQTGTIDTATAKHRIDSARRESLARVQLIAGIALLVVGAVVGFALPPALRWPQAGLYIAAVGLVLIILRDPPTWLIAVLGGATIATVVAYYSTRAPATDS